MNHDPLCPWVGYFVMDCDDCDLIAKVRADERDNAWKTLKGIQLKVAEDFDRIGEIKQFRKSVFVDFVDAMRGEQQ